MTATFANTLDTAKDRMRRALGDADVSTDPESGAPAWLREDEEYAAVLARYPDEDEATAVMAEALAAEFARRPDSFSESGSVSVTWRERVRTWLELAKRLRAGRAGSAGGAIVAITLERADEEQSEYVRPEWWTP